MAGLAAGFWSYVREDDEGDHNRITALAADLKERYRLHTGEELELFVDRTHIRWGNEWQERIDLAIAGTTFFIPIITPSYFRSTACRGELLKFDRVAEASGLTRLLLPIYWVEVPELENEPKSSRDEAIRIVAKYQREDFRLISLKDRDSSEYRSAVARLAAELVSRASDAASVADTEQAPPPPAGPTDLISQPDDDAPGLIEKLVGAEDAMEVTVGLIKRLGQEMEEANEILSSSAEEMQTAAGRGKGPKAALAITNRLANQLSKPAEKIALTGTNYGKALGELDPGIHAWLDLIESHDEPSTEDIKQLGEIDELVVASKTAAEQLQSTSDSAKEMANFSRSLRAPVGDFRSGLQGILDGNAVIEDWGRRAREIRGDSDGEDSDE